MDNFIEIYNDVFDKEYCESVIKYFKEFKQLGLTNTRLDHEGVSAIYKDDTALFSCDAVEKSIDGSVDLKHVTAQMYKDFTDKLFGIAYMQYARKYPILNELKQHKAYTVKIQETKAGQGYHTWHSEVGGKDTAERLLVFTAYLNDDFDAGETEFLYQHYRYKPKQGDVVIFPAAFTHVHRGNPPYNGDKYIITGWIEF